MQLAVSAKCRVNELVNSFSAYGSMCGLVFANPVANPYSLSCIFHLPATFFRPFVLCFHVQTMPICEQHVYKYAIYGHVIQILCQSAQSGRLKAVGAAHCRIPPTSFLLVHFQQFAARFPSRLRAVRLLLGFVPQPNLPIN